MRITVREILKEKEPFVLTAQTDEMVYDCMERMVEHNVGSILVMDDEDLSGIFTERDYLREITLEGRSSKSTPIGEVMSGELVVVDPDYYIQECMAIMTEQRCRHLPVIEDRELAGIVSIGDCVKTLSEKQKAKIRHLTDYIQGKYPR